MKMMISFQRQQDRWGLFNPPGIGPFDKDPDDDIPFRGFEEDPEK